MPGAAPGCGHAPRISEAFCAKYRDGRRLQLKAHLLQPRGWEGERTEEGRGGTAGVKRADALQ